MSRIICSLLLPFLFTAALTGSAQPAGFLKAPPGAPPTQPNEGRDTVLIPASQLRAVGVHNAGQMTLPVSGGAFPPYNAYAPQRDPETDVAMQGAVYPAGSANQYIYSAGLWVGGIVGQDTCVTTAFDTYWYGSREFWPADPNRGGMYRSGNFADDEFVAVYSDTLVSWPYVFYNPYDDTSHIPLGIEITQRSYSWKDSLYDNFVIIDYAVRNNGPNFIRDGWIGFAMDPDIYCLQSSNWFGGYSDDASGCLDTLLDPDDPASRIVIPYSLDFDGDPNSYGAWDTNSVRGAVSVSVLASSLPDPRYNFNWWVTGYYSDTDFGPRRLGTAEDPLRLFAGDFIGCPQTDEDKYYMLSHPEIDYHELELDIHDSVDGWLPAPESLENMTHDTKWLFSFGPFDLPPGDSITFAIAVAVSANVHVGPGDFGQYFDPQSPGEFLARLDFSNLVIDHRRADSVYRSGYTLPMPGPPVGFRIVDYGDDFITLAWCPSANPSLAGYYVSVKDTVFDDTWRHTTIHPITDTVYTVPLLNPGREYCFAVSQVDTLNRESGESFAVRFVAGSPHPPGGLTVALDDLVPVLNWQPYDDTSPAAYVIYRSVWQAPVTPYDSVSGWSYRDLGAESGVLYTYRVAAKNDLNLESPLTGPVSILPMVRDRGVLFYDMNFDYSVHIDPYDRRYVDRLVHSVQPQIDMEYYDIEDGQLTFKEMSHYSVIVFDSECRGGKILSAEIDSIRYYLMNGGKALFITPNASRGDPTINRLQTHAYYEGNMFHDVLRLDSAVTNAIIINGQAVVGDLMGCRSLSPDYPELEADPVKMAAGPITVEGFLPLSGFLYPRDSVEVLYRYRSMFSDSLIHDQINGIKYENDTYCFVFFNFPLSLMQAPANVAAFRRALTDLGVDVTCGDINGDESLDVGDAVALLRYVYQEGSALADLRRADVNCDARVSVEDALILINAIFRHGPGLSCCP